MRLRWLMALLPAAALGGAVTASADQLVMENGRTVQGTLIQVRGGVVTFDQDRGTRRSQRMRVRVEDVERIEFGDVVGDDDFFNDRPGDLNLRGTISVPSDRQWVDTGLNVRAGQALRFDPQGVVMWGPDRRHGPAGEPNSPYNANRPLPSSPGGSLVGRIGNDVFFIGSNTGILRARTSGRLYLGINDDYLRDNAGAFRVQVYH